MCERWVGDRTDCYILTPSSSDYSSISFSFCWAAQPGVLSAQALSWELVLTASNCNWLQLTQTVSGTQLYNCLTPTCFLWALHVHRIQPIHRSRWHLQYLRLECTCFLIDGWVEGQYVTILWHINHCRLFEANSISIHRNNSISNNLV